MPDTVVLTNTSSMDKTGHYEMNASADRSIQTAEVLDYDGLNGNYALFWKKIAISFHQGWSINKTASLHKDGIYYNTPWGDVVWNNQMVYTGKDIIKTTSARTVQFYLTYKVAGKKIDKLICACSMEMDSQEDNVSLELKYKVSSLSGRRVYGTSVQVDDKFIVYTYDLGSLIENFNFDGVKGYDGSYSFENWNEDGAGSPLWTFDKRIVGIINIADPSSDIGYLFEEEYSVMVTKNKLSPTVYSIGTVDK